MFAQFKPTRKGDFNAYIARSFRNKKGDKTSSVIVERFGLLSEIAVELPGVDPREWLRQRAAELTRKEKEENKKISVKLSPARRIQPGKKRVMPMAHPWTTIRSTSSEPPHSVAKSKRCSASQKQISTFAQYICRDKTA